MIAKAWIPLVTIGLSLLAFQPARGETPTERPSKPDPSGSGTRFPPDSNTPSPDRAIGAGTRGGAAPIVADNPRKTARSSPRILFQPPSTSRVPPNTRGAGSRQGGQCALDTDHPELSSLAVLVPPGASGLTVAERPALWVYVPPDSSREILLDVSETDGTNHSKTLIPLAGRSGIIRVEPPADSPALEVGKTYEWAVVLICGKRPSPNDPVVTGLVTRTAENLAPAHLTNSEKAAWYSERGIWYDALESVILAWQENPDRQDFRATWTEFLRSAGLESMATRPIRF
ncbi:DUF928 domain-containing protein [Pannus brasiliensis CCIBt3594]|uniref:DUF928 domain-containing protein n=1 Tax=Pannus brasiliensis CCIBt3594 TaxID=1427578 RepID=A0AAW9QNY2_9CHRO